MSPLAPADALAGFSRLGLLAQAPVEVDVVVPQMEGVTTAIVAFVFACVIYPQLVKNKTQFYGAFGAVLAVILLHSLNVMLGRESAGFQVFSGALSGLLQVAAIVLLFTSCGGVTLRQMAGDMGKAIEVIRRGEEEKTVIIPIHGEMPRPRQHGAATGAATSAAATDAGPAAERIEMSPDAGWPTKRNTGDAPASPSATAHPSPPAPPSSSIPLE